MRRFLAVLALSLIILAGCDSEEDSDWSNIVTSSNLAFGKVWNMTGSESIFFTGNGEVTYKGNICKYNPTTGNYFEVGQSSTLSTRRTSFTVKDLSGINDSNYDYIWIAANDGTNGRIYRHDWSQNDDIENYTPTVCSLTSIGERLNGVFCYLEGAAIHVVYVGGSSGNSYVMHYDSGDNSGAYGTSGYWHEDTFSASSGTVELMCVWGSGNANLWALGKNGRMFKYDATTTHQWDEITNTTAFTGDFTDIHGYDDASTGVKWWATGETNSYFGSTQGTIVHFDGTSLSLIDGFGPQDFNAIYAQSHSLVLAVGDAGQAFYYDGSDWTELSSDDSDISADCEGCFITSDGETFYITTSETSSLYGRIYRYYFAD